MKADRATDRPTDRPSSPPPRLGDKRLVARFAQKTTCLGHRWSPERAKTRDLSAIEYASKTTIHWPISTMHDPRPSQPPSASSGPTFSIPHAFTYIHTRYYAFVDYRSILSRCAVGRDLPRSRERTTTYACVSPNQSVFSLFLDGLVLLHATMREQFFKSRKTLRRLRKDRRTFFFYLFF